MLYPTRSAPARDGLSNPGVGLRLRDERHRERPEDEAVKRRDRGPVDATEQPAGAEDGALIQTGLVTFRVDSPLEPRLAREPHFGMQAHQPARFERFDAPEVHDVTDA